MQSIKLELQKTGGFSQLFLDYIQNNEKIRPFYNQYPDLEGFDKAISERVFEKEKRDVLVESLKNQYHHILDLPDFELLKNPNTYTVTTGHQLNIFTGPLYVIYKIVSTINLAKKLKEAFPNYNFVPVYWMATEDHDFEEINHFELFGKTYTWFTEQKGAVGRMHCTQIQEILEQLPEKPEPFITAYSTAQSLTEAVRFYMNSLFGTNGLICVDGDDKNLKEQFVPIIRQELKTAAFEKVNAQSAKLENLGYKTQVSAREINLFYLDNQLRERIVATENGYEIINTNLKFTQAELEKELSAHPEKFSPNVILRPVYQEAILPNIAYLGGPAEVVYWLQLKTSFEYFGIQFPIILPRNFALYLNYATQKKLQKLGLDNDSIWLGEQELKHKYLSIHAENLVDFENEKAGIETQFKAILNKTLTVDKSLEQAVLGEKQKTINNLENFEKRVKKAEERLHETGIQQTLALKNKLFPNGGPQERTENYLNYALNNNLFIEQLFQNFDPLDFSFNLLIEN